MRAATPKRTLLPLTFKKQHAQDIVLCLAAPHGEVRLVVFEVRRVPKPSGHVSSRLPFLLTLVPSHSPPRWAAFRACPHGCGELLSGLLRRHGRRHFLSCTYSWRATGAGASNWFILFQILCNYAISGNLNHKPCWTRASSFKSSSWHTAPSRLICRSIDRICPVVSRRETSSSSLAPRRSSLWSSLTALPAGSSSSSLSITRGVTRWRSSVARMVNDEAP